MIIIKLNEDLRVLSIMNFTSNIKTITDVKDFDLVVKFF